MFKALTASALALAFMLPIANAQSPAWTEAKANNSNVKQRPSLLDGPNTDLPETEKKLGHHGPVVIEGILAADGKLKEARVAVSSKASTLDEIAMAAANASTFVPAKDADGNPIPIVISVPYSLVAYKSATGGVYEYRCEQFVRDMDWWRSVNPERPFSEHELYKMELGLFATPILLRGGMNNPEVARTAHADFEKLWSAAIDHCRKKPKMLQKDALFR
jgi:TonB family protein